MASDSGDSGDFDAERGILRTPQQEAAERRAYRRNVLGFAEEDASEEEQELANLASPAEEATDLDPLSFYLQEQEFRESLLHEPQAGAGRTIVRFFRQVAGDDYESSEDVASSIDTASSSTLVPSHGVTMTTPLSPRLVSGSQTGVGTTSGSATTGLAPTTPLLHVVPEPPTSLQAKAPSTPVATAGKKEFEHDTCTMDDFTRPSGFISRDNRDDVRDKNPKLFMIWEEKVNKGLPSPKFKFVGEDLSDEALLLDTQDLYRQCDRLVHALMDLDLAYCFVMLDQIDWGTPENTPLTGPSLLMKDAWSSWSLKDVQNTQLFWMAHGGALHRDSHKRACRYLLESCEETLKARIETRLHNEYSPSVHGGLLTFKLIMDQLHINTFDMRIKLILLVEKMSIKDFAGQHVPTAVDRLNPLLTRLDGVLQQQWPADMVFKLLRVFQTTSCAKFNAHFEDCERELNGSETGILAGRRSSVSIGQYACLKGMLDITADAVAWYTRIQADQGWSYKGGKGSVFTGTTGAPNDGIPRKCWNCNSTKHQLKTCTKTRNPTMIEANKKQFNAAKQKLAQSRRAAKVADKDSTSTTSTTTTTTTPPGSDTTSAPKPKMLLIRSAALKKKPPEKDEPHRQVIDNRVHFWCGHKEEHCYWNATHKSKDHDKWTAAVANSQAQPGGQSTEARAHVAQLPDASLFTDAFSSWDE